MFHLDLQWIVSENGVKTLWIVNDYNEEMGWITEVSGKIIEWNFLGRRLDSKEAVYDENIQVLCPDLINMMIIYLVHQS